MLGSRSRNSEKNRRLRRRILVTLTVLGVVVLARFLPGAVSYVGGLLLAPAEYTQRWLRESEAVTAYWFRDRTTLIADIAAIRRLARSNQTTEAALARVQVENQHLRALLGATSSPRIVAGVIALPETTPYDLLQLDQGRRAGVQMGAPVFVGKDAVIGSIVHVAESYSLARLVSSPGVQSTVYIRGANVFAAMEGVGGGVARVRVPQGVTLTVGDVVVMPGSQPNQYGMIEYIVNEPTQPEQFGYVLPVQPLRGRAMVAIGQSPVPPLTRAALMEFMSATTSVWYVPMSDVLEDISMAATSSVVDS